MHPVWVRQLQTKLLDTDIVSRVRVYGNRIRIHYRDGFTRSYYYKGSHPTKKFLNITKDDTIKNWPIEIKYEHEWDPFDESNKLEMMKYFHVPRKTVDEMTIIERELLSHVLLEWILKNGYIRCHVRDDQVDADLERISTSQDTFVKKTFALRKSKYHHGRAVIEKYHETAFYDRDPERPLINAFSHKRLIFYIMQRLMLSKWDINISNYYRMLYRYRFGPTWTSPILYKVLLKQMFDIDENTVVADRHPNMGEKAISCGILGCKYMPLRKKPIPPEMVHKLGLQIVKPGKKSDILIWDNRFKDFDPEIAIEWLKITENLLVFVKRDRLKQARKIRQPDRIFKIRTSIGAGPDRPDYFLIYRKS